MTPSSSTSPDETRLRLRAVLHAQFAVILAVCLLVAAVGGGLAYTAHVDPGTETETRTVSSLTVESEYVHSAEVTEPNSVFSTGTVLDDRNTYFTRIAPVLDVDAETTYQAASASDVEVQLESVLVIRNVGEDDTVYWSERETLATETVSDVAPGETAAASFALNSSAVDATAGSIEEELGASPGETETFITTDVALDGTINGEPTSYSRTIEMDLTHNGNTYTAADPGVLSDSPDRTEEVTVEQSYGPLWAIGGPLLLLVGLIGAGGLGYARREGDLALIAAEREYLAYRDDRSEFAEWITQIRLPASVHEREEATASSLRDLVDFAIDNDTGVVEDPQTGAFHAVTPDLVYTYHPPSPEIGPGADGAGTDVAGVDGTGSDGAESDAAAADGAVSVGTAAAAVDADGAGGSNGTGDSNNGDEAN